MGSFLLGLLFIEAFEIELLKDEVNDPGDNQEVDGIGGKVTEQDRAKVPALETLGRTEDQPNERLYNILNKRRDDFINSTAKNEGDREANHALFAYKDDEFLERFFELLFHVEVRGRGDNSWDYLADFLRLLGGGFHRASA